MPKTFLCSGEVKNFLRNHSHQKCIASSTRILINGSFINTWLKEKRGNTTDVFPSNEEYQVESMPRSKYNITIQIIYEIINLIISSSFEKEIQLYRKLFLKYYEVYLVFCKRGPFLFRLLRRHSFKVNGNLSIVVGFIVRGAGELIFKIF